MKRIEAVDDDILRTIAYKTNKFLEFTKLNQKLKIRHCGSHQLDELFSSKFNQSIQIFLQSDQNSPKAILMHIAKYNTSKREFERKSVRFYCS